MQIFDYTDKRLILLGDTHGEFKLLTNWFKQQIQVIEDKGNRYRSKRQAKVVIPQNCAFVVCGDCGFGFNKHQYYIDSLNELQKLLEANNSVMLFIRGNHDDPEYFNTDNFELPFENIKLIPDYSILKTQKDISLCIGGAISIDRAWRKEENIRKNRFQSDFKRLIYWDNEFIHPNENLASELTESGLKVNSIISHTTSTRYFKNKISKFYDNEWIKNDDELKRDLDKENEILENIYNILTESLGFTIDWWVCGHMHEGLTTLAQNDKNVPVIHVLNIFKGSILEEFGDITTMQRGYISVLPSFKPQEKEEKKSAYQVMDALDWEIVDMPTYVNNNGEGTQVTFRDRPIF